MKYLALGIALLLATGIAQADGKVYSLDSTVRIVIDCTLPLEREDGTTMTTAEIAMVEMFDRQNMAMIPVQVDAQLNCPFSLDLTTLALGQHYIQMKAIDTDGRISKLSVDDARGTGIIPFVLRSGSPPSATTGLTVQ